jgi:hypothetical protein
MQDSDGGSLFVKLEPGTSEDDEQRMPIGGSDAEVQSDEEAEGISHEL